VRYPQRAGSATDCPTAVSMLRWRAARQPDQLAYRFLTDGERDEQTLSYAELDRGARAVAAQIVDRGGRGERALLLYPPGLDYITAFFGCLYAGAVAVPAYPPGPTRLARGLERLRSIAGEARPLLTLTTSASVAAIDAVAGTDGRSALGTVLATDETPAELASAWTPPTIDPSSTALLQYTSGSTATPRGVVLSHGNLMHNSGLIQRFFGYDAETRAVAWLPPYHDMGLIGGVIQPVYSGFPITLMSPVDFLARPLRWLSAMSRFAATTSGGPNFAYDLCVRKTSPEERSTLDLSRWRVALNGAEPIRPATLERFASAFAGSGFRREAFHPCYGLAEATLIVTGGVPWQAGGPAPDTSDASDGRWVSCGRAAEDERVVIVDAATMRESAAGTVGEIWVAGPSVAGSYWSRPDLSREVFQARLATGAGPFLRTGDLGFVSDGELFVTGRIKDLVIVRGRNHYPQDIEASAERAHPALRSGCTAAFTVPDDGEESLVVAVEVSDRTGGADIGGIASAVRSAVAHDHDIQVRTVVLLPPGGVEKTSSGKVQRTRCAHRYRAGTLGGHTIGWPAAESTAVALDRPRLLATPPEHRRAALVAYLRGRVATACGVGPDEVDPSRSLLALGADSLAIVAVTQAIRDDLGVTLSVSELVDAPTVHDVAQRLEVAAAAEPDRPDVIGKTAPTAPTGGPVETPLSHAQRALWFLQQLSPGSGEHNVCAALRLSGPLNTAALRRSLDRLVERHDALRATFTSRDGEPVALVGRTGTACVREHDAAGVGTGLARRLDDAANEPFDLVSGPLLRVHLYHTGPGETVLLVVAHHIVTDFWSMSTLVGELATVYAAGGHDTATLPPPVASYADVVAWQEQTLAGDGRRAMREFWAGELHGAVEELQLLRRTAGAPCQPATAGTGRVSVDEELTGRVRQLARSEGTSVYMVLLAAYQLLLHRYTGQADLVVGTPVAGRGRPEFERVVGYCMNPVAIRSRLDGDESVRDVLARVRRRVTGALDHATFPLHLLDTGRRGGAPTFRTLFVYNRPPGTGAGDLALHATDRPGRPRAFADLLAEPVEVRLREVPVDLHLSIAEIDGRLAGAFRYRSDLLDDDAAAQMMRHYRNVLAAMVEDVAQPAAAVALLDEPEQRRIVTGWSGERPAHAPGVTLADLVERQAVATPDGIAVTGEAGLLTYRELNARANRLARLLASRGIGPGSRIGLYLDRSPDMFVALLAAVKSGAAYVPADPSHPRDRIAVMFAEAGVETVLSQRHLADRLPGAVDAVLVDDEVTLGEFHDENLNLAIDDRSPVYVLYTSGSTGTPKGVVVSHRSLANYARFAAEHFAMSAGDRVLQFAALTFDASAQQIYAGLISGATLVLRNDRMLSSASAFLAQCRDWSITVLDLPTAYWHELVVGLDAGATVPDPLRLVIIGGERAVPDLVRTWHRRAGRRVRLINNYGPTEATIVAITRELTGYTLDEDEVPIGRPVAGATAYVLDPMRRPVPAGVVGELYLGGAGLADGYLGRPALTAQSFVPHPFDPGARLYRTGDLASFAADGQLFFRGRADRQIKLRGYRVEPGEIESALRKLPDVADALVVLRDNPRRLVGYLVGGGSGAPDDAQVRSALRRTLPEYMVPSAFVTVSAFPLNAHGKVDVAALPEPDPAAPRERTGPRTPTERFLVATFADVLGQPAIGVDDDFFGQGGHSLLATKVIARIRDRYRVDVPLRAVFETPTPAGLAERLERTASNQPSGAPTPPLVPVPRDRPLPLSFVQEGIWFLQLLSPQSTAYNVPRALRVRGQFDENILVEVFAALERRHEILRTTFPDVDGEPVQVIHPPRGIPVDVVDLQDVPGAEQEDRIQQMILVAGQTPFDLTTGPLIRLTLVRLAPSYHVLVIVEHHLIHDGWAQGVFLRDFLEVYEALMAGRPPALPELTVQFADYAYWQRQALSDEVLSGLVNFWTEELAGAPWMLTLPTDRPHPPALTYAGGLETLVIDGELGRALRQFSREHGSTLFMTMFSAFATLLYRYSGQDDILVAVGIANRQRPEAEHLLGMMINTVLLRAQMTGDPSFGELLERTRERCLRAYAHQDMPFAKLVQALRPKRTAAHMPLCQVLFAFLDTPMPPLEVTGLTLEPIEAHNRTAKFDLNVVVQPHAEQLPGALGTPADERLTVLWEYNADVFDAGTIRRMLSHFQAVLEAAVAAPQQPLSGFLADVEGTRPATLTAPVAP
jgi:amino acid adenylation domain-containing protein